MTIGVMQAEKGNHPSVDVHYGVGAVLAGAREEKEAEPERPVDLPTDMYIAGWTDIKWRPPTPATTPDHPCTQGSVLNNAFFGTPDSMDLTPVPIRP